MKHLERSEARVKYVFYIAVGHIIIGYGIGNTGILRIFQLIIGGGCGVLGSFCFVLSFTKNWWDDD